MDVSQKFLPIATTSIFPKCPDVLAHYTNQHGIIGILKSSEIWATIIRFLNDSNERQYGLSLALDILRQRIENKIYSHLSLAHLEMFKEELSRRGGSNICVCSWSENDDTLSQWRGYSKGSQGYAFCLSGSDLREIATSQNFWLGKCIYDYKTHAEIITEILDSCINSARHGTPPKPSDLAERITNWMLLVAPFIKDPGFAEEKEWRLVSTILPSDHANFSVRPGKSFPIPYYRFSLKKHGGPTQFWINVGPGNNKELASDGLHFLFDRSELKWSSMGSSRIPLRSEL